MASSPRRRSGDPSGKRTSPEPMAARPASPEETLENPAETSGAPALVPQDTVEAPPSATVTAPPPSRSDAAPGPTPAPSCPDDTLEDPALVPLDAAGAPASPTATVTAAPPRPADATATCSEAEWTGAMKALPPRESNLREEDGQPDEPRPGQSFQGASGSDFVLRERVGAGGQGEVWRAWQTNLGREVAVKRLRDVRGGASSVAEFMMEALTTAELDHPNIVPVHDLGRVKIQGEDSPLIAMKLARGTPWNKLLAEDRQADLEPGAFLAKHLRVLGDVCHAVAYAHSKGIIHRDLKPHQVIVGGFGEVFLVDWGLAVGLDDEAKEPAPAPGGVPRRHTLRTATNQTGTPAYMAPEQTQSGAGVLGVHTDIYLLGAILFELAAGSPPHPGQDARSAYKAAIANEVAELPEDCPAELRETIQKALSSDPRKRHASAEEFREEIESFLSGSGRRRESKDIAEEVAGELQEAPVESLGYADLTRLRMRLARSLQLWPENPRGLRLREVLLAGHSRRALAEGDLRFAESLAQALPADNEDRRKLLAQARLARRQAEREKKLKTLLLASCGVLLALLAAGGGLFAVHQKRAKEQVASERDRAEQARSEAVAAKLDAEDARAAAETARGQAEDARIVAEEARQSAERNLAIASEQGDGAYKLVLYVLDELKDRMEAELSPERGLEPSDANEIKHAIAGGVAGKVVDYFQDADPSGWPRELRLQRAGRLIETGDKFLDLGRYEEGEALTSASLRLREEILGPDDPGVVTALVTLGVLASRRGDPGKAEALYRRALAIQGKVQGDGGLRAAQIRVNLGLLLDERGESAEAEEAYNGALEVFERELGPGHPQTGKLLNNLSRLSWQRGDYAQAEKLSRRVLAIWEEAIGPEHPQIALGLNNLALLLNAQGRGNEAEPLYRRALAIFEKRLGPGHPATAEALSNLGLLCGGQEGRLEEAEAFHRRALAIREEALGPAHPSTLDSLNNLGLLLSDMGRPEEAAPLCLRAAEALRGKLEADPGNIDLLDGLGASLHALALVRAAAGSLPEARASNHEAIALRRSVAERYPDNPSALAALGESLYNGACFSSGAGDLEEAFALLDECAAAGWSDWEALAADPDLEPLRQADPGRFAAILERSKANADEPEPEPSASGAGEPEEAPASPGASE